MPDPTPLSVNLGRDLASRWFNGPGGHLFKGFPTADPNFEAAAVVLVGPDGQSPLVTSAGGVFTQGAVSHDAAAGPNPVMIGGYAKAAAPTDVSTDGDAVRAWLLRNGAVAAVLTAAGALIGGDAANGLDVDVTRTPFSTPTSPAHTQVAATTASATLLASSGGRRYAFLQNVGTVDVSVKLDGTAAVAGAGITLKANGGFYEMSTAFGNLTTNVLTCITASGTANVNVTAA